MSRIEISPASRMIELINHFDNSIILFYNISIIRYTSKAVNRVCTSAHTLLASVLLSLYY